MKKLFRILLLAVLYGLGQNKSVTGGHYVSTETYEQRLELPLLLHRVIQLLKKLSQCLAALQRLMQHKSNKLHNDLNIIYVIL